MAIAVGGEVAHPARKKAVQGGEPDDQDHLGLQPACDIGTPVHASHRPSAQLTTMAGVMIAWSSRRSITLKVSDCLEPGSASQ